MVKISDIVHIPHYIIDIDPRTQIIETAGMLPLEQRQ